MKDPRMTAIRLAALILEFTAVYIFSAPPYLFQDELPPAWPVILALLAGGAGYFPLRRKNALLAALVALVLAFLAGMTCGLSLGFSLILAVVAVWRFGAFASGGPHDTELAAALLSAGYGLAAFFLIGGEAGDALLKVLILQFGFAVFVRVAKTVLQTGQGGSKQDGVLAVLAAAAVLFAAAVLNLGPIMSRLAVPAAWLMSVLGSLVGWAASPFLQAAEPLLDLLNEKQEQIDSGQPDAGEAGEQEDFQFTGGDGLPDHPWAAVVFFILLLIVAAAVTLYLVHRYRAARSMQRPDVLPESRVPAESPGRRSPRSRRPSDPVRREVFRLERKMSHAGRGRRAGQTFGEWLADLGADRETADVLEGLYVRVRYGEGPATTEETKEFRRLIRRLG
ncbi:DUF4129 domain-containing protein [Bhargavaea ullalensis]|uniref:Lysylphosphatidylglycerol synthetase-like protein (DUF2156 family) n=1 Tax=Bhargavaea ullalensis TaxID=1265685 RepID=A0ABV2GAP9_9BACL